MGIREMRVRANKSVSEVQKALNVSDAAVYYWENGTTKPTVDNLMKLAKLYECSVDDLLYEEEKQWQS